uniref:Uncharacterized protein n=1 Tax=Meloidogyne enterolobii TaxID=390850 RepID=A0A6V7VW61_MELEN|nr:unnamed protein product [Meloidogyne enterolobii]
MDNNFLNKNKIKLLISIIIIFSVNIKNCNCCCKFRGEITPSLHEETKLAIKWHVNLECEECIKGGKYHQKTVIDSKNGKGARFEFDLIPARGKYIKKINVKISSLERLFGLERTNTWILKNPNCERLHRFQFGHFSPLNDKSLYLRFKFKNSLDDKLLVKLEENDLKMHYIVNIVKANDRKFILANRELSEDEWKGKTNIDVDLTKYKVISYIRTSKHYPMVISVKAVPTISCAICSLRKKTKLKTNVQKLHMIPGCNHFVHKKCANKRIRKNASLHYYRKKRQALESVKEDEGEGKESPSSSAPPTNADKIEEEGDPLPPPPLPSTPPHHLPSCSSSSSLSTCSHGSPTTQLEVASSSSHLPPQETNTDNENITKTNFEDKCPVIGCNKVVFMKKTSAGKYNLYY